MNKHLIILSIPFVRLGRVLLGAPVLTILKEQCDVLIVSPLAENLDFQAEFGDSKTKFFNWSAENQNSRFNQILASIVKILRVDGYWLRNRKKGLAYYHRNAIYLELEDCTQNKFPLLKSILYRFIAFAGYFRFSWRLIDSFRGLIFRDTKTIDNLIKNYGQVTIVQSANWGEQDLYLAWYARKKKIRSLFIPYTTDQIYINGYLLCSNVIVCLQGEFEKKCATLLQSIPVKQQKQLGSAWFRNYDQILELVNNCKKPTSKKVKYILFSGLSSQYFPKIAESKALDYLEQSIKQGVLGNVKIIYRPVATLDELEKINADWGNSDYVELELPQPGIIGLDNQSYQSLKKDWLEYAETIQKSDILVMSLFSSLALDLVYLGKPVFALFDDPTGRIAAKRTDLAFDLNGRIPSFDSIQIIHSIKELIPLIRKALDSPEQYKYQKESLQLLWDFPENNFQKMLAHLISET